MLHNSQIKFFNKRIGFTLESIIDDYNNPHLKSWINSVSGKSKGFAGEIFEWIITGEQGDNKAKPDFNGYEIKTISFDELGEKAIEKMSLTAVSYSTIEDEVFETSHVLDKSKIFIIKLTKNKNTLKRKFLGFGFIDLNLYTNQVKDEYNYYRSLVCEGKAELFNSSAKILGKNQILHIRTAGTTKYKRYTTKTGKEYTSKPYNFTLDYKVITRLIKEI
jgi:hypothetical protein|tara:strand:+ start:63 stop:719 length:657 start_codon:yes stop_codon:yes gene_type:complete